jgi:predicted S18 family serine protease
MKKLTKERVAEWARLTEAVRAAEAELAERIGFFNTDMQNAFERVESAASNLSEARTEAAQFRDDVVGDIESYVGERSEKWQDSDAAQSYGDWLDAWVSLDCSEVSIDPPEDIEPVDEIADEMDGVPREVEP